MPETGGNGRLFPAQPGHAGGLAAGLGHTAVAQLAGLIIYTAHGATRSIILSKLVVHFKIPGSLFFFWFIYSGFGTF